MDVENPNTALASEPEHDDSTPVKRKKKKKSRRFQPNFKIPGVHKLTLPEATQKAIACVVGETVTVEKPWITIDKELIIEHIEAHADSSEFLPLKEALQAYQVNEILVGYIPDESRDYDQFYFCTTEEATIAVQEIVQKLKKMQEDRLQNAVNRRVKEWKPLGSDREIDEAAMKYHRALLEVEIESKYPILPFKVHFKLVKTQQLRDGYMEMRSTDETQNIVYKKRIDAGTQVTQKVQPNEAQTICSYPKQSYTQYEYEVPEVSFQADHLKSINLDNICDILRVNGTIDLYANDYENLVLDKNCTLKSVLSAPKEYYCFIDMNLSGNKMISSLTWHSMWTGCAVAAYVDTAPSLYVKTKNTTDEVFKAIHDTNPVLFWSFTDNLKPKLILETPRPIYALSCCPYDPNIIIGGCINGQIVLWDISHKLQNVEEEEILTIHQQKYREHMFYLMDWMKNICDPAQLRPTALSSLQYSHHGCVNHISWLSPCHKTTKTGKFEIEESGQSLELMTAAEDGTIMIWDLLNKPTIGPGGFKAVRKLKRLRKRPSALSVSESPFKVLHLNLKPIYKINLVHPQDHFRFLGIASCCSNFFHTEYEVIGGRSQYEKHISERLIYKPIIDHKNSNIRKTFYVGTMEGDFIQAQWEGQEFDLGETVNFEEATWLNYGKYHDGPVISVDYSASVNTVLTVGGCIFALWNEQYPNRPILWRKSDNIYTFGCFATFDQSSIKLTRIDGNREVWSIFYQSKSAVNILLMSNGAISVGSGHPRKLALDVIAFCDYRGSCRLFNMKQLNTSAVKIREETMKTFLSKEIKRKKEFLNWQTKWNSRYQSVLDSIETKNIESTKIDSKSETSRRRDDSKKKIQKISAGQRYLESVQEEQKMSEQERIKSIILMKKQLDTEDLLRKREPLRKLEEENEAKRKRQRNRLKESDNIFRDQVAMLFPDVVRQKPPAPPDPYADRFGERMKQERFEKFQQMTREATGYVATHPFALSFRWSNVLRMGRERRRRLDENSVREGHRERFGKMKVTKVQMEEKSEEMEKEKSVVLGDVEE